MLQDAIEASPYGTIQPKDLWNAINAKYVLADTVFQAVINVEKKTWNISKPVMEGDKDAVQLREIENNTVVYV